MGNYKKSAEEISTIMKYAYEQAIPVTPRGSGTGLVGSSVAIKHDFFYPPDPGEKNLQRSVEISAQMQVACVP